MRLFVALEVPAAVKQAAAEVMGRLKGAGEDVKWVRPEGMHLTLKFLGETPEDLLPELCRSLDQACRGREALSLKLAGCGAFPGVRSPRVVWLGLGGEMEELAGLAAAVEEALVGLGFPPEGRPFRPHLTLGRVRSGRRGRKGGRKSSAAPLGRAIVELARWRGPAFQAESVALMQSTLTPAGAVYRPLHTITLERRGKEP